MLSGIPGESDSWYAEMAKWLPEIFHLQPPSGVVRVRYDRFSPYHTRAQDFGLTLQPSRAYAYVYPLPNESLMRLAYSFEDSRKPGHVHRGMHEHPGQQELQQVVQYWNQIWKSARPVLRVYDYGRRLQIVDTRPCAYRRNWTAGELESDIYRLCDSAQTVGSLSKQLSISVQEIEPAIENLCDAKVVMRLNGRLLAIGVNGNHSS